MFPSESHEREFGDSNPMVLEQNNDEDDESCVDRVKFSKISAILKCHIYTITVSKYTAGKYVRYLSCTY
jgi:hypothetical protein